MRYKDGFSQVALGLIVLAVIIIAGGLYYALKSNAPLTTQQPTSNQTIIQNTTSATANGNGADNQGAIPIQPTTGNTYAVVLADWRDKNPADVSYPSDWVSLPVTSQSAAMQLNGVPPEIDGVIFAPADQVSPDKTISSNNYVEIGGAQNDCTILRREANYDGSPLLCAKGVRGMDAIDAMFTRSTSTDVVGFYNSLLTSMQGEGWTITSY